MPGRQSMTPSRLAQDVPTTCQDGTEEPQDISTDHPDTTKTQSRRSRLRYNAATTLIDVITMLPDFQRNSMQYCVILECVINIYRINSKICVQITELVQNK